MNRRGSAPPSFSVGDMALHQYMSNSGLQSPQMTRNGLMASPKLGSPGMVSPGLLLGQVSPDMGQYPSRASGRMGRMVDASALPGPPLQSQFENLNQMNAQQQAAMMMNAQMGNSYGSNMGGAGMMSPQHIQLQNQLNAQQAAMNQLSQQLQQQQQQQQQMNSQADFAELQMLQNKLQNLQRQNIATANMNNSAMTGPNMVSRNAFQPSHTNSAEFDPRLPLDNMAPPAPVQSGTPRQRNSGHTYQMPANANASTTMKPLQHSGQPKQQHVDTLPGNNPRRMPPPSLMKREDSMKMEKVFGAASPSSTKKKVDGNNSSAHLSAMSLSIGDMNEEGNLSSVFDSSLRISGADKSGNDNAHPAKEKLKDRSGNGNWENNLEMSVNTLGTGTGSEMRLSEAGNMSYATLNDPNLQESDGNMSFGKVFDDPDRD